ncbi:MAG: hypothetical protein K8U57_00075 [Planctomycetes bacterium]|nr:hypothetical protein [Planctomycetota bacterium]
MPADAPDGVDIAMLVDAVIAAIAQRLDRPQPQTFAQPDAWQYLGLSRSAWFRAKSADLLPRPIHIEGTGDRWRRKDLDQWLERQKPRRK